MKIAAVLFGSLFCAFAVAEDVPSPALACNPNGIDAAEWPHYEKLLGLLYSAARERRELSDGYTVRLDGKKISLQETAQWISLERLCCPFLTFQVEVAGATDDCWLTLKGPSGVKAFLDAELAIVPVRNKVGP
jgi:hypothetical protein